MKIYLLDNFDSFTYNLVDQFRTLGHQVVVYRNDIDAEYIAEQLTGSSKPTILVLSPGPGSPEQAGNMMALLSKLAGKVPLLGICLGHQALIKHYGGEISRAQAIVHGKASKITHTGHPVFNSLTSHLPVARYHSLIGSTIPDCLEVIATIDELSVDQIPMAVSHKQDAAIGFQFHPESILTTAGSQLLLQTLQYLTDTFYASHK